MAKRGKEILQSKNIRFSDEAMVKLARESGGDFRSFLLDLQFFSSEGGLDENAIGSSGARERSMNIFSVLPKILGAKTVAEAREAANASEVDPDMLVRWIEENLPRRFDSPASLAAAFEPFSRADVFEGRILRRQHYSFKRYSGDLSTAGVALSGHDHAHGFISYQFPSLLRRLSQSKGARQIRLSAAKKVADRSHAGAKEIIRQDWAFLEQMMAHKPWAVAMTHHFGFDEKELGLLLHAKPDSKKVQSLLEEARGAPVDEKPSPALTPKKKSKTAEAPSAEGHSETSDSPPAGAEPLSLTKQKRAKAEAEPAEEAHRQTRLF
jgi:replication factor C large subunit